jgi:hypothetical protein
VLRIKALDKSISKLDIIAKTIAVNSLKPKIFGTA